MLPAISDSYRDELFDGDPDIDDGAQAHAPPSELPSIIDAHSYISAQIEAIEQRALMKQPDGGSVLQKEMGDQDVAATKLQSSVRMRQARGRVENQRRNETKGQNCVEPQKTDRRAEGPKPQPTPRSESIEPGVETTNDQVHKYPSPLHFAN